MVECDVSLWTPLPVDDEAGLLLLITAGSVAARVSAVVGGTDKPRAAPNRLASLIHDVVS